MEGARRTLIVGVLAIGVLIMGVALSIRAGLSSLRLSQVRTDFVANVTHELKTPLATIQAAGQTLVGGRLTDPEAQHHYAAMVVQEAKHLGRLIDNLLMCSRVSAVQPGQAASRPVRLASVVSDTLGRFDVQLRERGFTVDVDMQEGFPPVLGDDAALRLVLDNVLDNAIRYSADERRIRIAGHGKDDAVVVTVTDLGIGIHADDVASVKRKLFRARNASAAGTGLGLTIADRIVTDHGGSLSIRSHVDQGTSVAITLPAAGKGR